MARKRFYDTTHDEACYLLQVDTIVDRCADEPFTLTSEMRAYLVSLLKRFDSFYEIDVLSYVILPTKIQLCVCRRKNASESLSLLEVAERQQKFLSKKKRIDARSVECRHVKERMNSISDFMGRFLQEASSAINSQFGDWHGHVWRERFKSHFLSDESSFRACLKEVEEGAAGTDGYPYSSFGEEDMKSCEVYRNRIENSLGFYQNIS